MPTVNRSFVIAGLMAAAAACGGDSTSPPDNTAAGSYTAVSFVTSGSSGQTNQIAAGSTLQIVLAPDGSTSGHLHMPASSSNPAIDADMTGSWTQSGDVVTFTQSADTFIRNMAFTLSFDPANGWTLVGDQTFSGTNIKITLKRAA